MTLRTKDTDRKYRKFLREEYTGTCIFCREEELVTSYSLWVLTKNKFPYDKIASEHYLLSPKRHIEEEGELYGSERDELYKILDELDYNMRITNKKKDCSVPQHLHYHILILK